jgi:hypothetical protein
MKGYPERAIFTVMSPPSRAINAESVPSGLFKQKLPTLIVRQNGEARSRPFVAIVDAFNNEGALKIQKVNYFSAINNRPEFVGIAVQSGSDRVDYIYNDALGEMKYDFEDGGFTGTYGIASYQNEILQALFLGKGTYFEKRSWKIETTQSDGAVLVVSDEGGLIISAEQPFKLTMPVDKSKKAVKLKRADQPAGQIISGKRSTKDMQNYIQFDLPALTNVKFEVID